MKQKIYQIDAFASEVFRGNPAAVCIMDSWLDDRLMQQIAMENNLSETAFVVADGADFVIRWFTPELEVALCGHATLASAFVLFEIEGYTGDRISFLSPHSGPLAVSKAPDGKLVLDFPADPAETIAMVPEIAQAIGGNPTSCLKGKTDYLLIYETQAEIEALRPNFFQLDQVDARGVIVSAPGLEKDFVSRFFAPQAGVNEDPVTGSAHTTLTPYWANRLGKEKMSAAQLSRRGGELECELIGDRVKIAGNAICYLKGEIAL